MTLHFRPGHGRQSQNRPTRAGGQTTGVSLALRLVAVAILAAACVERVVGTNGDEPLAYDDPEVIEATCEQWCENANGCCPIGSEDCWWQAIVECAEGCIGMREEYNLSDVCWQRAMDLYSCTGSLSCDKYLEYRVGASHDDPRYPCKDEHEQYDSTTAECFLG